jgi:hypothetical protein
MSQTRDTIFNLSYAADTDIDNLQNELDVLEAEVKSSDLKKSVFVATTVANGNLDLATGGLLILDSTSTYVDARVLVKNQTDPIENGIYLAKTGSWVRADDFDGSFPSQVSGGTRAFVESGTDNASTVWVVDGAGDRTIDTDAITFSILADLDTIAQDAAQSASEALTSETNAGTSETNAATSETNAANSAAAALTSEGNAATSETNAATSESNAATSETNAATSESNALTSETNAAASAAAAAASAASIAHKPYVIEDAVREDLTHDFGADVYKMSFAFGNNEPSPGDILQGNTGSYTAVVVDVILVETGDWSTDDAIGEIVMTNLSNGLSTFSAFEVITNTTQANTFAVAGNDLGLTPGVFRNIKLSNDGTKIYTALNITNGINDQVGLVMEYDLSTAYDPKTSTFNGNVLNLSSWTTEKPFSGIHFNQGAASAIGFVELTGGAAGSVNQITINSVDIMSGAEAFDTTLDITAENIVANINAHTSSPNYSAYIQDGTDTSNSLIVIVSDTTGTSANGYTVTSDATTITTTDTDMAGGADGAGEILYAIVERDLSHITVINQYSLSTAWNVSTAAESYPYQSNLTENLNDTDLKHGRAIYLSEDGTKIYIINAIDAGGRGLYQMDLEVPYSILGIKSLSQDDFTEVPNLGSVMTTPRYMDFSVDGRYLVVGGNENNSCDKFVLATAWEVETATAVVEDITIFKAIVGGNDDVGPPHIEGGIFSRDGYDFYVINDDGLMAQYYTSKIVHVRP